MSGGKTIAFFPEPGAWGPTNNCSAIGGVLRERGHRIVFVVDASFAGVLEARGFEERLFRMTPAEDATEAVDATEANVRLPIPWSEFIRVTAPEFRKPTIEQIETVTQPIWQTLVAAEQYAHERVMAIWDEVHPDVVVTDNVTGYPAVELAGAPWVRVVSCNPLEMRDADLPPALSGLPVADRSDWAAFRDEYHRVHADLLASTTRSGPRSASSRVRRTSSTPPRRGWTSTSSPTPRTTRATPLAPTWHRLESSVRGGEPAFDVAEHLPGDGKVVYLSLGSLGCMDVGLMQRLIDALATTGAPRHRVDGSAQGRDAAR